MRQVISDHYALADAPPRVGGQSLVYRAVDLAANPPRNVAVKVLNRLDDGALSQLFFEREVDSLRKLRHPNIVELVDTGRDPDSGDRYLVLEWVDNDLVALLSAGPIPFDDFVGKYALPLSSALAVAHELGILHRDVKPGNVLIARDGTPKLADFAISKIKSSLTIDPRTAAQFMSRPYAPPEHESTSSYTRDVFGFGVLMLRCLVERSISDYPDIPAALDELDVTPALYSLIERCVDFDPAQRPQNGAVLYAELESLYRRRSARWRPRAVVFLSLGYKARSWLAETMHAPSEEVDQRILDDLRDAPALRRLDDSAEADDAAPHFFLYGSTFSYRVIVQDDGIKQPSLFIMGVVPVEASKGDFARERNLVLDNVDFRFGTAVSHAEARAGLQALVAQAERFETERQLEADRRERWRLLDEWRRQIAARDSIETGKERPVRYSRATVDGSRVLFRVDDDLSQVLTGEVRRVEGSETRHGPTLRGEVESVDGDRVIMYFEASPENISGRGRLLVDTTAARIKIDREKAALADVMNASGDIVRPDLREILIDPRIAAPAVAVAVSEWVQNDLDQDKCDAVEKALGCPDVFAVDGPPGTGKTTFIAELVAQELKRNPNALILISSQTNVALDNALGRIHRLELPARLIRLADAKATRVSAEAQPFLIEPQMLEWRSAVRNRSQEYLEEWCQTYGVDHATVRLALLLQEVATQRRIADHLSEVIEAESAELEKLDSQGSPVLTDEERAELADLRDEHTRQQRDLVRDTRASLERCVEQLSARSLSVEGATPDELVDLATGLLQGAGEHAEELRALVQVQTEWLQRLGHGDDFIEPLVLGSQVLGGTCVGIARYRSLRNAEFDLCIVDEASKATATETLVPMVRARRWVLVGDQRQLPPFLEDALRNKAVQADFNLDPAELRRTLFDRLADFLPKENRVSLKTQRRMTEAIGELISHCFYGDDLISDGPHPIGPIPGTLPKPVTWLSTSALAHRFERADHFDATSWVNVEEAREVIAALRRLNRWVRERDGLDRLAALVISPYRAQVTLLRHRVANVAMELESLSIEVNTIDAVQGREADVVVFSVTRSNAEGDLGFLSAEARANVALSRAKQGLIIVGDARFCAGKPGPLADVVRHIETHPQQCEIRELRP